MPRPRSIDLTGRKFGKLEVLEAVPGGLWRCRCLCGAFRNVRTSDLIRPAPKSVRSCGCAKVRPARARKGKSARWLTFAGRTESISQWSRLTGLDPKTISRRLARGWTVEETLGRAYYRWH